MHLVAIVGPTGVGKSNLALRLAQEFGGEIVGADSRQVYRYMDIGTAKPTRGEMGLVPHHLIDIINPDEEFSLAQYQALAYQAISEIHARGRLPLLVGGTGQWVWGVLEGWRVPKVIPDAEFRRELERRAVAGEGESLYRELSRTDPTAAGRIDPRNVRPVIRALEVSRAAGVPFSALRKKSPPPFQTSVVGLTIARSELYRRIDARVDRMLEEGLVGEVERLTAMGYSPDLPSMSGIGYQQIAQYLRGETDLATATERTKTGTHRFARHQYAWFRLSDPRIAWLDIQGTSFGETARRLIAAFVGRD
jgi:tRNA dimethylallyltransferase